MSFFIAELTACILSLYLIFSTGTPDLFTNVYYAISNIFEANGLLFLGSVLMELACSTKRLSFAYGHFHLQIQLSCFSGMGCYKDVPLSRHSFPILKHAGTTSS